VVARAPQSCALRDELTLEVDFQTSEVSLARGLDSMDGIISLTRSVLTIPELFVPDVFYSLAGHHIPGYLWVVSRKLNFCRHLTAPAGACNTNEGLTPNLR